VFYRCMSSWCLFDCHCRYCCLSACLVVMSALLSMSSRLSGCSATIQGEPLCRDFVDTNILDFCHPNDKERLKKHHDEGRDLAWTNNWNRIAVDRIWPSTDLPNDRLYMWPICKKSVVSRKIRFQDVEQIPRKRHFFQLIQILIWIYLFCMKS